MGVTIAVAGKGGTGKTSISALLIKLLSERGIVLAIDADPATNLNMALGLPLEETVGQVRENMAKEVKSGRFSPGISKPDYLEFKIRESLVESPGIDLLAMGRPEGPGCYCAANNMLRGSIDRLAKSYDYTVIDCEAGMEHLSRQTTRDVDILILVSDPTLRGITTAVRMKELIGELRTSVGKIALVVNRVRGPLSTEVSTAIREAGLDIVATINEDSQASELDARGAPLPELPESAPLKQGVKEIAQRLGLYVTT